jgi:chromosome partitioning protein
MKVISVFSQKGGCGKSMLTVHLAVQAHLAGLRVVILDTDDNGNAVKWFGRRALSWPVAVAVPEGSLDRAVEGANADGYDWVIIDSPPHSAPLAARIVGVADLVVVPIKPEPFDWEVIDSTVRLVGQKKSVFVLSDCPQRAPEIVETRDYLQQFNRPILGPIHNWRSMYRALKEGLAISEATPSSGAAEEIRGLFKGIQGALA